MLIYLWLSLHTLKSFLMGLSNLFTSLFTLSVLNLISVIMVLIKVFTLKLSPKSIFFNCSIVHSLEKCRAFYFLTFSVFNYASMLISVIIFHTISRKPLTVITFDPSLSHFITYLINISCYWNLSSLFFIKTCLEILDLTLRNK